MAVVAAFSHQSTFRCFLLKHCFFSLYSVSSKSGVDKLLPIGQCGLQPVFLQSTVRMVFYSTKGLLKKSNKTKNMQETICVPQSLKIFTLSLYKKFADPNFIKNCFSLVAIQSFYQDLLTEKQTLSCLHF